MRARLSVPGTTTARKASFTLALLSELLEERLRFLTSLKANVLFERPFTKGLTKLVGTDALPTEQRGTVNVSDVSNYISSRIGWEWASLIDGPFNEKRLAPQTAGDRFTTEIRLFLQNAVAICQGLRNTDWHYQLEEVAKTRAGPKAATSIAKNPRIKAFEFAQYRHLRMIRDTFIARPDLEAVFGSDYVVEPDIVVFSKPFNVDELGGRPEQPVATYSPLLSGAKDMGEAPLLHASVSCKLTLRSDRAQNARLEALNLIRTRKGRTPTIAFVTAEPLPSRLASLALGTGDVDCIYHAGLYELVQALEATIKFGEGRLPVDEFEDDPRLQALEVEPDDEADIDVGAAEAKPTRTGLLKQRARLLSMMGQGRLRDVSDLPLDLLI
jgi:hypothetical protein